MSVTCNCQLYEMIPYVTQESIVVVELDMATTGKHTLHLLEHCFPTR